MLNITMKDVEKGDILIFDSGKRAKVRAIDFLDPDSFQSYRILTEEGEIIWVSEDGLRDMNAKTDFVRAIGCYDSSDEPSLEYLLKTDDLPEEMKWVVKKFSFGGEYRLNKRTKAFFDILKPFNRDFSSSELAVLYYRANKRPIKEYAMRKNLTDWTKRGYLVKTKYGRWRLK